MISTKLENVFSDIRGALYVRALEKEKNGERVLKLNTGNPAAFGFKMPDSVKSKLTASVDKALGYCDVRGMAESREAICNYHKSLGVEGISAQDVYITNGVSEAAYLAVTALCSDGDEFLLPSPAYSLWVNMIRLAGGKAVFYNCDEKSDWNPDVEDIRRKITPKTKAIILINPNNPTGAVYSRETVESIYRLASERGLVIFSDEIYDRLLMDGAKHIPTATLGDDTLIVTFNGLSKSHCLCGFRCGWLVVSGNSEKKKEMNTALTTICSIRLCSGALMQLIVPDALNDKEYTERMIGEGGRLYRQNKLASSLLSGIDGVELVENKAAFYLFPKLDLKRFNLSDDRDFASKLLEEKNILVVAGSGFYCTDNCHFRIVALPEEKDLEKAITDIGDFLKGRMN